MRHSLHLILGDLVGNDGEPFIQLHRIAIDNFAIEPAGYLDGQLPNVMSKVVRLKGDTYIGLARSSCAHDSNQWLGRGRSHPRGGIMLDGAEHTSSGVPRCSDESSGPEVPKKSRDFACQMRLDALAASPLIVQRRY